MTDEQYDKAKDFLLNNNYYRVSGYTLTMRHNDTFTENASLDKLIQIYEADKRMRQTILSVIEVIEVRLKSMLAYYHCEKYGPTGYLDINTFNCMDRNRINIHTVDNYLYITRKAASQKNAMTDSEPFIKHHKENKKDILPFWVYVEILTLSDISKLYSILDYVTQKKIAFQLGFRHSNGHEILENLLHCVTILRNISAHGGRLYNRLFTRKPRLSRREKSFLLTTEDGHIINDRLFSYILVLKSLSPSNDFQLVREHLILINENYPLIDFFQYGFPENWKEIL
ncbi:Abi family protein [Sporosarcina newyorkensis]|nr:Abi family protein [Sporosarcina newyorkensis]